MRTIVVTPPAALVALPEAKDHLKVTHDAEDALIAAYIAGACAHIDGPGGWLGRAIGAQVLEVRTAGFGCGVIALPYPEVTAVQSVKYLDQEGEETTIAPSTYELRGRDLGTAWGQTWPTVGYEAGNGEAVRVRYSAGYQPGAPQLAVAKAAVLLMIGDLYRNRGEALINQTTATVAMSTTVQGLLGPLRVFR